MNVVFDYYLIIIIVRSIIISVNDLKDSIIFKAMRRKRNKESTVYLLLPISGIASWKFVKCILDKTNFKLRSSFLVVLLVHPEEPGVPGHGHQLGHDELVQVRHLHVRRGLDDGAAPPPDLLRALLRHLLLLLQAGGLDHIHGASWVTSTSDDNKLVLTTLNEDFVSVSGKKYCPIVAV